MYPNRYYDAFGVDMSNAQLKSGMDENDPYTMLYRKIKKSAPSLSKEIEEFYKANEGDYSEELYSFYDFCEDWFEDAAILTTGIESVICTMINEICFQGNTIFRYDDCAIHVPAYIPADKKSKEIMPTQEDIKTIIATHIQPLYNTTLRPEMMSIAC